MASWHAALDCRSSSPERAAAAAAAATGVLMLGGLGEARARVSRERLGRATADGVAEVREVMAEEETGNEAEAAGGGGGGTEGECGGAMPA